MREAAIGIFDSGIGGLTVLQQVARLLPREVLVYLGDTARSPYGTKSPEVVTRYACENTDFLMARGLKMLVVACNTASAVALSTQEDRTMAQTITVMVPVYDGVTQLDFTGPHQFLSRTPDVQVRVASLDGRPAFG